MATIKTYNRGIRGIAIAQWLAENSYGTLYPVTGARGGNLQWVTESDEIRGDDVVLDRFTKAVAATVSIQEAVIDLTIYNMIIGGTLTSIAAYYDLKIADTDDAPYVGVVGHVVGSSGDLHFFLPKAKISGNLQLNAQVDAYLIPQWDMQGVNEGTINGIMRLRHYPTTHALAIPLANT